MSATATKPAAYALRLPRGLYDELVGEAAREGVSVNMLIVAVLAGALKWKAP
jgi:predicted HicB family RNase H-like nuclease